MAFAAALPCCVAAPYVVEGRAVRILDGDTIEILDANKVTHKVRLAEIDAPEKNQPYGKDAKAALSKMVFGKPVTVKVSTRDRYGREIGNVYLGKIDVNGSLVKYGYAWVYGQYPHRDVLIEYEQDARQNERGLWAAEKQIPPWDYRKGIR